MKQYTLCFLLGAAFFFTFTTQGFCANHQSIAAQKPKICKVAQVIFAKTSAAKTCGVEECPIYNFERQCFLSHQPLQISGNKLTGACSGPISVGQHVSVSIPCSQVCPALINNNGHLSGCNLEHLHS